MNRSGGPRLTRRQRWRHLWIRSGWQRWLFPVICSLPYLLSLLWLLQRGQVWVVQIMLTPLLMVAALALVTWILARFEFRLSRGPR